MSIEITDSDLKKIYSLLREIQNPNPSNIEHDAMNYRSKEREYMQDNAYEISLLLNACKGK